MSTPTENQLPHKQIDRDEYERWLANPVTKMYVECLRAYGAQRQKLAGEFGFLNNDSLEQTGVNAHILRTAISTVNEIQPGALPATFNMISTPEPDPEVKDETVS